MAERAKRERSEVVSARVEIGTLDTLCAEALRNDRTLSGQVRRVLRTWSTQIDPSAGSATTIVARGVSE